MGFASLTALQEYFLYQFQMISGKIDACWHPSGVRVDQDRITGVSLRSTPGYLLSSLRDEKTNYHLEMVLNPKLALGGDEMVQDSEPK